MSRWPLTAIFAGGLLLFRLHAAEVPAPPIEELIRQLGDKNFRVRELAGRGLEARGDEALPKLRAALAANDPEIHRRIEVLTARIERQQLLTAKKITLKGDNLSVKDAIELIAKQTGYKMALQGEVSAKLNYSFQDEPFWNVINRLIADGGLYLNWDTGDEKLIFYHNDTCNPYTSVSGPFYLIAQNCNYSRYVNLMSLPRRNPSQDQQSESLFFSFLIQSEPKAPILSVGQAKLTKAVDENGQSLIPRNRADEVAVRYYDGGYRNFQFNANVPLHKPNRDAQRAKVIRGVLPVVVLARVKPEIAIDKVATLKKKKFTGQTVDITMEEVKEENGIVNVTVQIQRVGPFDPNDNAWMNNIAQKLELYDEKGVKFNGNGASSVTNTTPTSVSASYQFSPPANGEKIGKATKLVYNQWITLEHEVEFEFKEVPLP